jgi:hypothetical protein
VLRIRLFEIRNPVLFWLLDPGSGINISSHLSEAVW